MIFRKIHTIIQKNIYYSIIDLLFIRMYNFLLWGYANTLKHLDSFMSILETLAISMAPWNGLK